MSGKVPLILCFILLSMYGCKNLTTIQGKIQYGEGDCMPMIDGDRQRAYKPYSGEVYAFPKEWVDSSHSTDIELLKKGYTPFTVTDGRLEIKLPAGRWVIMPSGFYLYNEDNTLIVPADGTISRDFTFFKCLTY